MKQADSEGSTLSTTAEDSRAEVRQTSERPVPLTRSEPPARHDMSPAREPGDLQLALPGMEPGELVRQVHEDVLRTTRLEKSDGSIVPEKLANKAQAAEPVEGRDPAKGKVAQGNPYRTQGRNIGGVTELARLRRRSTRRAAKEERFTNLFTHLRVDLLRRVFYRLKKQAAPGVDGQTWRMYEGDLDARLADLQDRLHRGAYRPSPVRRTYIPKASGAKRPLGIPTVEDKVVQGAVVALLTPIFEAGFLDCSYAFRPGRSQHQALGSVERMMFRGKVNWVLDLDIKSYFDSIDHEWLVQMLEHRIGDRRLVRLIRRWLKAGVLEDGVLEASAQGTPQGGLISPLLSNVYLHYVLDLWFERKERGQLNGTAHMVRYADDVILGFQYEHEARRFRRRLEQRLAKFGLRMHPDKTRLLRFGKFALQDCHRDGRRKPETFDFLGLTHITGRSPQGKFWLIRRTARRKREAKLRELRAEMRRRMHWRVADQWRWLSSVLRGHYAYYGVSGNYRALTQFRTRVRWLWYRSLQRRSQRARMNRKKLNRLDRRFPLPTPRILPSTRRVRLAL